MVGALTCKCGSNRLGFELVDKKTSIHFDQYCVKCLACSKRGNVSFTKKNAKEAWNVERRNEMLKRGN